MSARSRIKAVLEFECPDRIGMGDAYWIETVKQWHKEGLPEGITPPDYFDLDFDYTFLDASLRFPERIVKETEEYVVREDKHGFTAKEWKNKSGALDYMDHKIKTKEDWEKYRSRLKVDLGETSRIDTVSYFPAFVQYSSWDEVKEEFRELRRREKFILLVVYGPFEATWRKHGFERTLINMLQKPEFIADMFDAHIDLVIQTTKKALKEGIRPDGLFLCEDMGFKSGMLFSPKTYRQLLFPQHMRLGDFLNSQNISYFVHTDGKISTIIPLLIDAGVKVLQPLQADVLDVRQLKRQYGSQLVFMGNIDARKMSGTKREIEKEIKGKLTIAKEGGGYIYHSDHSVPPSVSFDNYRYVMGLVRKYGQYS